MSDEVYYYLATDYYATGEGMTKALMVTRAYPSMEDYEEQPSLDGLNYNPGKLKLSKEEIAKREFKDTFGSFLAHGVEVMSKHDFFARFGQFIPGTVEKILNAESPEDMPGNFKWHALTHLNYS
jgi:hypothetical protein